MALAYEKYLQEILIDGPTQIEIVKAERAKSPPEREDEDADEE